MQLYGPTAKFWLGSDLFVGTIELDLIEVGILLKLIEWIPLYSFTNIPSRTDIESVM